MKSFDNFLEDIDPVLVMLGMTHEVTVFKDKQNDMDLLYIRIEKELTINISVRYSKKNFHKINRKVFFNRNMTYEEYMNNRKPEIKIYTHGKLVKEVTELLMKEVV